MAAGDRLAPISEIQEQLQSVAAHIREAARRARRFWRLAWGALLSLIISAPVAGILGYYLRITVTTVTSGGGTSTTTGPPTWIPALVIVPFAVVLGLAFRELFIVRAQARKAGPFRAPPIESVSQKGFWSCAEIIQESQRVLTQAGSQIGFTFFVLLADGLAFGVALQLFLSPYVDVSWPSPLWFDYLVPIVVAAFAAVLWPVSRVVRRSIALYQDSLNAQVRGISALETEFFERFALQTSPG
jgi:hypothetical protein